MYLSQTVRAPWGKVTAISQSRKQPRNVIMGFGRNVDLHVTNSNVYDSFASMIDRKEERVQKAKTWDLE
jgi:hypothetical protein